MARRRRAWSVAATSLSVVMLLAACSSSSSPEDPLPEPPVLTTYDRLAAEVTSTGDPTLSLQLFALQFGPLPGVPVPADGEGPPTEANLAISAVFSVWSQISNSQRSAVRKILELPANFDPNAPVRSTRNAATAGYSTARTASAYTAQPAVVPSAVDLAPYQAAGRAAESALSAELGPLGVPVVYRANSRAPVSDGTPALASALVTGGECRITVYPSFTPPTGPSVTLAHELTHCYQQVWRGETYMPRALWWIQEGSAEWAGSVVGATLGGVADRDIFGYFAEWINTPRTTLDRRTYAAYGLFAYANMRVDVWDRLRATTVANSTEEAVRALSSGIDFDNFVAEWASTQMHRSELGAQWTITGPGVPTNPRSLALNFEDLANGSEAALTSPSWATSNTARAVSAETVRFIAGSPTVGRVHLSDGTRQFAELTGQAWCTSRDGNCTCPAGTAREGEQLPRLDGSRLVAAVGAGGAASSARIVGKSLREECGEAGDCPVGTWELERQAEIPRVTVESGGTGTKLIITDDGSVVQSFADYVPLLAKSSGREPITVYLAPTGQVTGKIEIPADGAFTASPIIDVDASGLRGTAYTQIGTQRVTIPVSDLRDMGIALGSSRASRGPAKLVCDGPDRVTIDAAPGVTQSYRRIG